MTEVHNWLNPSLIPEDVPEEMVNDFRNHIWACFKYINLGEPTPMQYAIADALQGHAQDLQMQALRGAGKSVITAMIASWFLLRDPNKNVMVISATSQKAIEFISMVRKIITYVPYMKHLEPQVNDKDNAFGFNIGGNTVKARQDLSCFAKGITSQITGSHADYIIVDDVEIEGNCETPAQREKLLGKLTEIENIRNVGGRVIFLGTPQTGDSIYFKLAEHYPVVKFPGVYPDPEIPEEWDNVSQYIKDLLLEPGGPTEPIRFSEDVLRARLSKLGPSRFALHYKLTTGTSDTARYPLKLKDLIVMDTDRDVFPEKVVWSGQQQNQNIPTYGLAGDKVCNPMYVATKFLKYSERVAFIDPSGRGADETAICVASFAHGYIVVHELTGIQGGYDEGTMRKICSFLRDYRVTECWIEDNFGDGMFTSLLSPHVAQKVGSCAIRGFKVTKGKEDRICDTLEPVMSTHRLVMDTKVLMDKENQMQLTRMQRKRNALKHDDRVDILASTVRHWADSVSLDTDKAARDREQIEWESKMRDFVVCPRGMNAKHNGTLKYTQMGLPDLPQRQTNLFDQARNRGFPKFNRGRR